MTLLDTKAQTMFSARTSTAHLPVLDPTAQDRSVLTTTLVRALTTRRAHGSVDEAKFVAWLCNRLPVSLIDEAGNIHVDTRHHPAHRSMFTAHTDTVHRAGGVNVVRLDGDLWRADEGSALGADDGAGVALLHHMISRGVPGYYVFFRGEECGGVGSSWLAANMPELFTDIDRAIAFDRAGYSDVITHQAGGRCCSDEFADALSLALSSDVDWFTASSGGVYTDTAEFTSLVPECTNISVGYDHQHGDREQQDVPFLRRLASYVLEVQWDALPTSRVVSGSTRDEEYEVDELMDALVDASDGEFATLLDLMAEAIAPDDIGLALRSINVNRLTPTLIDEAADRLDRGVPPAGILLMLYDASSTFIGTDHE